MISNTLEWDYRVMYWNVMISYDNNNFGCCDWNNILMWWNVKTLITAMV